MDAFDIVILGFDRSRPDSPAAGLQRVFPIDQGTAVRLINALPATVKRGVPQAAAEQYRAALVAIGARVELKLAEPKAPAPLPPNAPTPVVPQVAPALLASSRFTGAATLKQGSPADSVLPASPSQAAVSFTGHPSAPPTLPSAPAPAIASPSPSRPAPAGLPLDNFGREGSAAADAPTVVPAVSTPAPAVAASAAITAASGAPPVASQAPAPAWGALQVSPPAAPASSTPLGAEPAASLGTAPGEEREHNRRELFRRLMDPRQTGPAELAPEDHGGISALELDLPPPRAGWASANQETVGADDVVAPNAPTAPIPASQPPAPMAKGARPAAPQVVHSQRPQPAVQVSIPPADARSFSEAMPDAIALSLREGGALWVLCGAGIGVLAALLTFSLRDHDVLRVLTSIAMALLLAACVSEQALWTLRAVVDDLDSPDAPDLRGSDLGRYFTAAFNLLCMGLALQGPFLIWLSRHRETLPGALTSEPFGLLLCALGTIYWPMAVSLPAMTENPMAGWSMGRGVRVILAAPFEYLSLMLTATIMVLLPIGLSLLLTRMGLPGEVLWVGIGVGASLSQGAIAALMGHIARLYPRAFEDD